MIARLDGILLARDVQRVLLDVGGVGYEVDVPLSALAQMPEVGNRVVLHTHLIVREDAHILCGFWSRRDRDLFRRLLRVSGVGTRLGLAMLSTLAADELAGYITSANTAALTRIPGIGKRTAERIVLELGERLHDLGFASTDADGATTVRPTLGIESEAASALEALGYRAADVEKMLQAVRGQAETTEALVRLALRATVKG